MVQTMVQIAPWMVQFAVVQKRGLFAHAFAPTWCQNGGNEVHIAHGFAPR